MTDPVNAETEGGRYAAPALEKGLEILETLASLSEPVGQKQLAGQLGRSVGEIFRMLSVLERLGYVARDPRGGYLLTAKLYELAHRHAPLRRLVASAAPVLERLAAETLQSYYLVVLGGGGDHILVVAQADPPTWRVLSVKLGARFPLRTGSTSALVIAAFSTPGERASLAARMDDPAGDLPARLDLIARQGSVVVPTQVIPGVTDVSAPVFDASGRVVAALSANHLPRREVTTPGLDHLHARLVDAAKEVSRSLGWAGTPGPSGVPGDGGPAPQR